ncbi:fatty acyl-AMP ligase [Actinomadura madurae]|uniref:fatty acyl-AMP ligase n=1 Tax=Actinomadura madurae TaxID=1993 RepID=UPI00202765C3|nr:fatty acyl-AMP ligase [Actinomadura madurae]MCP9978868.1 fatty acyl-AMP ligase [Actinomadura madurae]MCQ0009603.1 fatty acyl-AMP ligase [Actinomadura madurae]MCQ0015057.1 fatty acyl-AMP ligase [Actinomadura madurae]URM95190.1 fatty acyl-AMP ligase [Actinomadura madurae]URN05899.1 fatty acyl-AMP ligase [Actinomadura madurae]
MTGLPDLDRTPLIERLGRFAAEFPGDRAYTFMDYMTDPDGIATHVTWGELDRRARAVAAAIRRAAGPGRRVALLAPQDLHYVTGFLGAMYARAIGVPLFSPDLPGHGDRLLAVYRDAEPDVVVTTSAALPHVRSFLDGDRVREPAEVIVADELDQSPGWTPEPIDPDDIAYLQYTSGSTRTPAGVIITHGNFATNAEQLWRTFDGIPRESSGVNWLPVFHDMGLVTTVALPLVYGNPGVIMDPVAFIMRPVRWLELLSRQKHAFTGGPNFAYEYLTAQVTEEEKRNLDLSGVQVFMNGAEPIRESTLSGFYEAFKDCGLRPEAQVCAYGLAEATVYVSASSRFKEPTRAAFDHEKLRRGVAEPCDADAPGAIRLLACGTSYGQHVAIADPETGARLADGTVGEIWVHGPNVAAGYWGRPEATKETFEAELAHSGDLPGGPWLRTGDLGVLHGGELFVTGRIKDLIIVDGRNHYPQDIEFTVSGAHKAIRREYTCAVSAVSDDTDDTGGTEGLVVVAERNRRVPIALLDPDEVAQAVRTAVNQQHDLRVHDFVLIEPGGLPRTSSGKIARSACRLAYLEGRLPVTEPPARPE